VRRNKKQTRKKNEQENLYVESNICLCVTVAEKRRFIKRERASEPADLDVEHASDANNQQTVIAGDAFDSVKSAAATLSLLNGHSAAEYQPSEATTAVDIINLQ